MNKIFYISAVILAAIVFAMGAGDNASATDNPASTLKLHYPVRNNIYWVKGEDYELSISTKNWGQIAWKIECDGSTRMNSIFNVPGDLTVESHHRIRVSVASSMMSSDSCYATVEGVGAARPYVTNVSRSVSISPFRIVDPVAVTGNLEIVDVKGLKSSYVQGEPISISFRVLKNDGTSVTPTEDIGVEVRINYTTKLYGISGPDVMDYPNYNYETGVWSWNTKASLNPTSYALHIITWCSLSGGKCEWQYGPGNQVERNDLTFSVVPPQTSPTNTGGSINSNCLIWPRKEKINPIKTYKLSEICDGDLIRAEGDIAVYIVKIKNDKYFIRRLFGPQIFNAYSHLGFNKVKKVTPTTLNRFSDSTYLSLYGNNTVLSIGDITPGVKAKLYYAPAGVDPDSVFVINNLEYNLYESVGTN